MPGLLLLVVGCGFLVLSSIPLHSQTGRTSNREAVRVLKTTGSIGRSYGKYQITVLGTVTNALSTPVTNVEVEVRLPTAGKVSKTVVSRIEPGKTGVFTVSFRVASKVSTYIPRVVSYKLQTQDVRWLFYYFWKNNKDIVLRETVVTRLENMPSGGQHGVIAYFRGLPKGSLALDVNRDMIEVLLLLPALRRSKRMDAAQVLLDKAVIFDSTRYRVAFDLLKLVAKKRNTVVPLLNKVAKQKKGLHELMCDAIVGIGSPALPALLLTSPNNSRKYVLAQQVLRRMGVDTLEKKVNALLDAATGGNMSQRKAVDIVLDRMPPQTEKVLMKLMVFASPQKRAYIASRLRRYWAYALPYISAELRQKGLVLPGTASMNDALDKLRALCVHEKISKIQQLYDKGLGQCRTGKVPKTGSGLAGLQRMEQSLAKNAEHIGIKTIDVKNYQREKKLLNIYWHPDNKQRRGLPFLCRLLEEEAGALNRSREPDAAQRYMEHTMDVYPLLFIREKLGHLYRQSLEKAWIDEQWEQAEAYLARMEIYTADMGMSPQQVAGLYNKQAQIAGQKKMWQKAIAYYHKAGEIAGNPLQAREAESKIRVKKDWVLLLILLILAISTAISIVNRQLRMLRENEGKGAQ
jgi:hypothetical protein